MRLAWLLLVIGCEKSGPVEATPGVATGSSVAAPAIVAPDAGVVTTPNDAPPIARAPDAPAPRPRPRPVRDADRLAEEANRIADMLVASGGDDLVIHNTRQRPGGDLARQLDDVRQRGGSVQVGGARGAGSARGGGTASPIQTSPQIGPGAPPPKPPLGRIAIARKHAVDDTTLTADQVLAKLQSVYMAGLKRCYREHLTKDPGARGKIRLTLAVGANGLTTGAAAQGFAKDVDDCIAGGMTSWRFPIPRDRDGEPTIAHFEIDLVAVPD